MLTIRIKKNPDETGSLSMTRPDGTATWQRQRQGHAAFFAYHDLTHYAVEMELGHRRGFYGLVAEGWEISDFGTPWPRGPIPADADPSELIVGLMDLQRRTGVEWSAAELNEQAAAALAAAGTEAPVPRLSQPQLDGIRRRMDELFARWEAVPAGEALELQFQPE